MGGQLCSQEAITVCCPEPKECYLPAQFEGVCHLQVSAGYDAHWRDPLAGLQMRNSTYHRLAAQLKALADRLCGARFPALPRIPTRTRRHDQRNTLQSVSALPPGACH